MNLPNKLTIGRMCAIPVIIAIALMTFLQDIVIVETINLQDVLLLVVFVAASFTDFLDGKIARKRNIVTNFGKFMDPLADKLLVMSMLIILLELQKFTVFGLSCGFVIIIVLAREFAVTGLRTLAADNRIVISASKLGKSKTFSQMIMITVLIINCYPLACFGEVVRDVTALVLIGVATILTIVSGIDYFVKNKHVLKGK